MTTPMNRDDKGGRGGELELHLRLECQVHFYLFFIFFDYTNIYLETIVCVYGHHHHNTQPQQQ